MRSRICLLVTLLFLFVYPAVGQMARVQAMFMYNFTKYIQWPNDAIKDNFVIAVYGSDMVFKELKVVVKNKTVSKKPIVVVKINELSELGTVHILYVDRRKSSEIDEIKDKLQYSNTLIVAEKHGMIENGAAINFIIVDNKQRFEISRENISKYQLNLNVSLEEFGVEK